MKPQDLGRILTNIEGDTPQIIFVVADFDEDLTVLGPWKVEVVQVKPGVSFVRINKVRAPLERTIVWLDRIVKLFTKK